VTVTSLAHDVNVIERHSPARARNLEDSLDIGHRRHMETGDASYFRLVLDMIHREAENLRSHDRRVTDERRG
jgi:hypothetical protein